MADAREIKTLAGVLARFEKITPCSAAQEQLSWKEIACHWVDVSSIFLSRRMSTHPKKKHAFYIVRHAIFYADYARKIAVTGLRKIIQH